MKQFLLCLTVLLSITFLSSSYGQVCNTTTLTNQTDVNNFVCTSVNGDLIIEDDNDGFDNIVDLDPIWANGMRSSNNSSVSGDVIVRNCNNLPTIYGLDGIIHIGGDLIIRNNNAMVTSYFYDLQTIDGSIIIEDNQLLQEIESFLDLTSIGGDLLIKRNPSLTKIASFSKLETINGDLYIDDNDALTTFNDLNVLTTIGNVLDIARNDQLLNFNGFAALESVGSYISFYDNPILTTINSFDQLITIGSIYINICPSVSSISDFPNLESAGVVRMNGTNLSTISGFPSLLEATIDINDNANLTSITGFANLENAGYIRISGNSALTSISTFSGLSSVDAFISIDDNDALVNINGFNALTTTGGRLDIARNDNLINFDGFSQLMSTGGWISFYDNPNLTTVSSFDQLNSIGVSFLVDICPSLTSIPEFPSLQTVIDKIFIKGTNLQTISGFPLLSSASTIQIVDNSNLTSITGFDGLLTSGDINISGNTLTSINAFTSLTSLSSFLKINNNPTLVSISGFDQLSTIGGELQISQNGSLTTINGFGNFMTALDRIDISFNNALTDLTEFPSLSSVAADFRLYDNQGLVSYTGLNNLETVGNDLWVYQNISMTEINAFASLTSIANDLVVVNNWNLADCCLFLPAIAATNGVVNIAVNSPGCNSEAEIGMNAPSISCPADFTVSNNGGVCEGSVTMMDPTPIDDCGVTAYTLTLINADGTVVYNNVTAIPDLVETLTLPVGINTYTYTATDLSGQTATCQTIVEVVDTEAPVWNDVDAASTVFGECGIDNPVDLLNANVPTATDNCTIVSVSLVQSTSTSGCGNTITETHNFRATDDASNVSVDYVLTIVIEDATSPVLSTLPVDVTISCNEAFPTVPSATAVDQCAGDLTSAITVTSDVTTGNCTLNTAAEIHTYTYSVVDDCGNMDDAEWIVTVMNDFEFELGPDIAVCDVSNTTITAPSGAISYAWSDGSTTQSINVTNSGAYTVTLTSTNGCCHSDFVNVTFGTAPNALAVGGELDCGGNPVQIFGNSSTTGVSYFWTGPGGFTSSMQAPFVTQAGIYDLMVTDMNGCTQNASATVTANTDVPEAIASGGTINCLVQSVQLMADSSEPGVTYSWIGPNGYSSTDQNPIATVAGIYTVEVLAPNSCIGTASTEVIEDTTLPTANATAGVLTCSINSTTISTNASSSVSQYAWTGPSGFVSDIAEPIVDVVGTYVLVVTADNGCTSEISIEVTGDFTVPDGSATGGILSCTASQIQLTGNSSSSNVNYSWTGPQGFTSTLQNPSVTLAGTYVLTVTAQNGCTTTAQAVVTADEDTPSASATGGVIDCNNATVILTADSDNPGASFSWTGPLGYASDLQNPEVNVSGTYVLVVTAENGCSTSLNTNVTLDTASSIVMVDLASVNCDLSNVSLGSETNTPQGSYQWTGPNGFSTTILNPNVDVAGVYTLIITPSNGCQGSASINIEGPFGNPDISTTGATLGCSDVSTSIMGNSSIPGVSYSWTGPGNFSSIDQNPMVTEPGNYTLEVTSPNGCMATQTAIVTGDTDLPQATAVGGTLDCNFTEINLEGSSTTSNVTLGWTGPNGFTSDEANPLVTTPGTYILTVTSESGCSVTASVTVEEDIDIPFIATSQGDVDCDGGTKEFIAQTNAVNSSFEWTGPNAFTSDQLVIDVTDAGTYIFTVFPPNGCTTEKPETLDFDITYTHEITTVDATESTLGMASIDITGGTAPFNILWDNGDTGTSADELEEGLHIVTVIDGLACSQTFEFEIQTIIAVLEENLSEKISLFPSPASSEITIQLQDEHRNIHSVSFYDMTGNLVSMTPWNPALDGLARAFDVSQYTSGAYIVLLNKEGGYYVKKLIIE